MRSSSAGISASMASGLEQASTTPEADRGVGIIDRRVGALVLRLIGSWDDWVHRRVERVRLCDPITFSRHVSLDFTLPRNLRSPIKDGRGREIFLVPLSFLRKRPLTNLDVRDQSGASLPVLTRRRNAALAASLLAAMAEAAAPQELTGKHGAELPDEIATDIWDVVSLDPPQAQDALSRLLCGDASDSAEVSAWRSYLRTDSAFKAMANALARSFILAVPLVGDPGTRRIIKYSYDDDGDQPLPKLPRILQGLARLWVRWVSGPSSEEAAPSLRRRDWRTWMARAVGLRPIWVRIEAPAISFGGSYHLEFEAPAGLQATVAELEARGTRSRRFVTIRKSLERVHLYLPNKPADCVGGDALVTLRPRPWTIVRGASLVSWFAVALLTYVTVFAEEIVSSLGSAVPLLLLIPGLISTVVARSGEPAATIHALAGLRLLTASVGLWPLVAGMALGAGTSCEQVGIDGSKVCTVDVGLSCVLSVLLATSTATAVLLTVVLTRIWRPPEQRQSTPVRP